MPQFDRERFVPATCTHSRFGKRGTLLAVDCKKGLSSCKLTHPPYGKTWVYLPGVDIIGVLLLICFILPCLLLLLLLLLLIEYCSDVYFVLVIFADKAMPRWGANSFEATSVACAAP